ncbi:hypothetical protein A6U87_06650 [Rhizobium sp. AC44/96]|uniref:peptidoglycan-binding domain-containing protein n=1 Tax=Rhizobium sp. AC44/96 TaxID=1841654 RepID=UPI00080F8713|nr:hypothetical protein A6U87_06650 [Rhizobium sp. AC44/96]
MAFQTRFAAGLLSCAVWALWSPSTLAEIRPVRDVQTALSEQGFEAGAPDGLWGAKSVAALKGFQRAHGMTPSGIVTQESLRALFPDAGRSSEVATLPSAEPLSSSVTAKADEPADVAERPQEPSSEAPLDLAQSTDIGKSESSQSDGGYLAAVILVVLGALALRGKAKRPRRR